MDEVQSVLTAALSEVETEPAVEEEGTQEEQEATGETEADDTLEASEAGDQGADDASETQFLSDEELEELGDDPDSRLKGMQAAYTRKTQKLAELRKPYEGLDAESQRYGLTAEDLKQFVPILAGLKRNPTEMAQKLYQQFSQQAANGDSDKPSPVAAALNEKLSKALGPDIAKEIAPTIADAIQEAAREETARQTEPLREQQQRSSLKAMAAEWKSKNPDVDADVEKRMTDLYNQVQEGGMTAVWDVLKMAVTSSSNGEKTAAEIQRRLSKPAPKLDKGKPPSKEGGFEMPDDLDIQGAIELLSKQIPA